jgi:hypothetical protein
MMTSYLATFSPCDKTKPAQPLPMTATVGFDMISELLKPLFGAGATQVIYLIWLLMSPLYLVVDIFVSAEIRQINRQRGPNSFGVPRYRQEAVFD